MKNRRLLIVVLGLIALLTVGILAYRSWHSGSGLGTRDQLLSLLPDDPSVVVFLDLAQFRSSSFLPQLLDWVPRDSVEEDYAQFVHATGFNYEQDLDQVTLAVSRLGTATNFFAIAEGRFDRKKMEAYAARSGRIINQKGLVVYSLILKNATHPSYVTFLRDDRIAWTDDPSFGSLFQSTQSFSGKRDWQEHFVRLGGSAVFAVMRQDSASVAGLAQQAPGGFRSPQLASLLAQLQWVTIGGKPDGNDLQVVIEGESPLESTLNQLKEFLGGLLIMAQAGLNGPQNRKQMNPQLREAYLEILKSAEVEKVDRATGKSVRIVFEVPPGFLEAVKKSTVSGAASGH